MVQNSEHYQTKLHAVCEELRLAIKIWAEAKAKLMFAEFDLSKQRGLLLIEYRAKADELGKNEAQRSAALDEMLRPLVDEVHKLEVETLKAAAHRDSQEILWRTLRTVVAASTPDAYETGKNAQ